MQTKLWFSSCLVAVVAVGCAEVHGPASAESRMTERQALAVAEAAMATRFPGEVEAHRPYHAKFADGSWSVWGTALGTVRGGGAPEALVRDSDGTVTEVHLSR